MGQVQSVSFLEKLPGLLELENRARALAALDAVLCPAWEFRYHSFDGAWNLEKNHRMASMRDGSGDEVYLIFTDQGAALKGYAHEVPANPAAEEFLKSVPEPFKACFLEEPAFSMQNLSFCAWCETGGEWDRSPIPEHSEGDGSEHLLALVVGKAQEYRSWAQGYFEIPVNYKAIEKVFAFQPIDRALVRTLNPQLEMEDVEQDLEQIGYPVLDH